MLAAPSQLRVNRMAALPSEAHDAFSYSGFEGCDVLAGVGNHSAEAGVEFACAGRMGHFCEIAWMKSAAGKNNDAVASLLDEGAKNRCATLSIGSAAGGEDAMRAGTDDGFEGGGEIFCFVEGAVKRHLHGRGEGDEFAGPLCVHRAIRAKDARDDALHILAVKRRNLFLHPRKFVSAIDEVTGAWPD